MLRIFFVLFLSSCAKLGYLSEQASGQLALEYNGRDNEEILSDINVPNVYKKKIQDIEKYKDYFFKFFDIEDTGIYDETTILDTKAVTYLVIVSPKNQIKALETEFPIVGKFPYLGFFKESSAKEYATKMEGEGYSTYTREVYAYSTLNQWIFDDNILSSFFVFNEFDLAELIFHELTHTIFFVTDEVELNENVAELIARELAFKYFEMSPKDIQKYKNYRVKENQLNQLISNLKDELNLKYKTSKDYQKELDDFMINHFKPRIKSKCKELELTRCRALNSNWNNARFAAFGTYHNEEAFLDGIYNKFDGDIKKLMSYLESMYKSYNSNDQNYKSFKDFLKGKN